MFSFRVTLRTCLQDGRVRKRTSRVMKHMIRLKELKKKPIVCKSRPNNLFYYYTTPLELAMSRVTSFSFHTIV